LTITAERTYAPWGTAREVLNRRDGELLVSGPAGTGKSRACLEKLHTMCAINPEMRALIVRKTAASLGSTALVTYREHVLKESLAVGAVDYYGGSASEPPQYRYANGSKVMIGGMDKPDKVMSSEYDLIYAQEATELTVEDWEALNSRLRNGRVSFQQLLADCNPNTPTHWLKRRCESGSTVMINSRHEDNPTLFNRDGTLTERGRQYMERLDKLTGVRYMRLRKGLWVAAEGLVYDNFDPTVHLRDRFTPPRDWPRIWSLDFGYTNPFVCQFWARDPDGRLYLYREIYMTRRLVEDHCASIARVVMKNPTKVEGEPWVGEWREPQPQYIVADHDAEGRATFERHMGMGTRPAHKAVTEGIQAVEKRLEVASDGKPRIIFCRDAVVERDQDLIDRMKPASTIEEITGYVWDIRDGKPPKEEPVKEDDHGMDTTRYITAEEDLKGRLKFRSLR
jgi:PBSX family phage terminase large subunit